ncbi:MAG: dicarboxylate/amino acid:cation symporter [Legionellaceae bacterium]|nr:dicarboxylate/amino acid:cation symporter [Legionellaceae bacterium]
MEQPLAWYQRTTTWYAIALILGICCGYSQNATLHHIASFLTDVFVRLFQCISLPIIALSIIVTLCHYQPEGNMYSIWRKTMTYTFGTTFVAALLAFVLYQWIHPALVIQTSKQAVPALLSSDHSYWTYVSGIIPSSILDPFVNHQVFSVLLLSVVIGCAIRFIPDAEAHQTIVHFFKGWHSLFVVITHWIIRIIPLGLFGFIATTIVQLREGADLGGLGSYLLVIVLANLVQGCIILPIWLYLKGLNPWKVFRAVLPALTVAFFSKSSVGTLPVTMNAAEKNLGIDPDVSRFIFPLCTSINMNGCAAFIFTTVVYLMQNAGVPMTTMSMLLWVGIATIAAIGNAGVPMGCFFLSASLLASMNVPITLMGVILPFYTLIDMLETALNVWSDVCVVQVLHHQLSKERVLVPSN